MGKNSMWEVEEVDTPDTNNFWLQGKWSPEIQDHLKDLTEVINNLHQTVSTEDLADLMQGVGVYLRHKANFEGFGFYSVSEIYPLTGYIEDSEE